MKIRTRKIVKSTNSDVYDLIDNDFTEGKEIDNLIYEEDLLDSQDNNDNIAYYMGSGCLRNGVPIVDIRRYS